MTALTKYSKKPVVSNKFFTGVAKFFVEVVDEEKQ